MDFPSDPSGPLLDLVKEEGTSESKMRTTFKKTEHQHKWLVLHLTVSDKFGALCSEFTLGEVRAGIDGYYRTKLGILSGAWRIESNCGTQYIQKEWIITGKPEYHNSDRGVLEGHLGVMCVIKIMESILGSTSPMFNTCDNISDLRQVSIHPESVKSRWK